MMEEAYQQSDLLTRDGHVSEMTLNRLVAGELSGPESEFIQAHLADCPPCADLEASVAAFDAEFSIQPPAPASPAPKSVDEPEKVVDLSERRARRTQVLGVVGVVLAAAAALLIVGPMLEQPAPQVPLEEPGDGIRLKGADLSIEVYAKSGQEAARAVGMGDVVHPGDRLGFRLTSREDGHVMIVGADDSGAVYPIYPQGKSTSEFVRATDQARELETAIRLDDVGSSERIVLARCADSFDFRDLEKHVSGALDAVKRPGQDPLGACVYDNVVLKKRAR